MPLSPLETEPPRPVHELLQAVRPHERAPAERPFVFLNFVATADGRAALEGRTQKLGGDDDLELLLELRALADAGFFQSPGQPVLVYAGAPGEPPEVPDPVEVVHLADPTLAAARAARRGR